MNKLPNSKVRELSRIFPGFKGRSGCSWKQYLRKNEFIYNFKPLVYKLFFEKEPKQEEIEKNIYSISAFDHWLSTEEYNNYHANEWKFFDKTNTSKILSFASEIYNEHEIYCLTYNLRFGRLFLGFKDKQEFLFQLNKSIEAYKYFYLVLPKIESLMIFALWDYTVGVYDFGKSSKNTLKNKADKHSLFLI